MPLNSAPITCVSMDNGSMCKKIMQQFQVHSKDMKLFSVDENEPTVDAISAPPLKVSPALSYQMRKVSPHSLNLIPVMRGPSWAGFSSRFLMTEAEGHILKLTLSQQGPLN